jgi:hypothetical protein
MNPIMERLCDKLDANAYLLKRGLKPFAGMRSMMEVSYGHVTFDDMKLITGPELSAAREVLPTTANYPEGSLIFGRGFYETAEMEDFMQALEDVGFSEAFLELQYLAYVLNVDFILLERDGDTIDMLKVFEW